MGIRVILLGVLILSGIGLVVAYFFNPTQNDPGKVVITQHMVVVAATPIATGALINPQMLTFAPPPPNAQGQSVFDRVEAQDGNQPAADAKTLNEITGAVARRRIEQGDPILHGVVLKPGDSGFLAAVLQPGMRAITVDVNARTSTGGLVYPGDRVDVLLTQNFNQTEIPLARRTSSEVAATDLRVLAIDQRLQANMGPANEGSKVPATVTLEVDPNQAQEIAVAARLGELSLIVRSLQSAPQVSTASDTGPKPEYSGDVSESLRKVSEDIKKAQATAGPTGPVVTIHRGPAKEDVTLR